jgi:hypothetical protein
MTDRLTGIEARLDAATPGPWVTEPVEQGMFADIESRVSGMRGYILLSHVDGEAGQAKTPDAVFIAAAPTDMAALLGAVKAVLELHRPVQVFFPDYVEGYYECEQCMEAHPCPTVAAITTALEGTK